MRCPVARSIVCGFAFFRPAPFMPAHTTHGDDPHALAECIATHDFCFLPADHTKNGLASLEAGWNSDWERFAASWGSLERDTYMADGGRYRRRRDIRAAARQMAPQRSADPPRAAATICGERRDPGGGDRP